MPEWSLRRFTLVRDKKVCFIGATQWSFVSFVDGRSREIPKEVKDAFPALEPDDPVLVKLASTCVPIIRWTLFAVSRA